MEKNPKNSEEKEKEESSENGRENMQMWFQENLRMLVSIVIVVAIAGGIYAYSKRTQAPPVSDETVVSEDSEGKISVIGDENAQEPATESEDQAATAEKPAEVAQKPQETAPAPSAEISQETEASFVETAAKGDSTTKLARRALANYLEKTPDSGLTAEHKIYIEDYLRRQVQNHSLGIGETREFSKTLIADAIQKSKGLNEGQLKNLEKYSSRVPELK